MSTYESYDEKCTTYDNGRKPMGLQLYRSFLKSHFDQPLNEIHVLDAGCGTGNFSVGLLQQGVGKVTMLDASQGMLGAAKSKVAAHFKPDRYDSVKGSLLKLPFGDATFKAVTVNFVLHHLEDGNDKSFKNSKRALEECYRVLMPGGLMLMLIQSHFHLLECYWFSAYLPSRVKDEILKYNIDISLAKSHLKEVGFQSIARYTPLDEIWLSEKAFFDFEGILKKDWRDMISTFTFCTPDETSAMLEQIRRSMEDGSFQKIVEEKEANRRNSGSALVLISSKSK